MKKLKVVAIVGPTASGKTNLARFLAEELGGELVSADSRQVYRRLDIGTGKEGELEPNATSSALHMKYSKIRSIANIPQWLTDVVEPIQSYSVADFQQDAYEVINDIHARQKLPILVGGSGLYVSAILDGYDFSQRPERNPENRRHATGSYQKSPPDWDVLMIGTELLRQELYRRIDQRVDDRLTQGMIKEAKQLISAGVSLDRLRSIGLEYRYLADLLENKLTEDEFKTQLKSAIHRYARRQLAWWRHHGQVHWVKSAAAALSLIKASFLT